MKCSEIMEILEELAPKELACEWDNPGLLAGRGDKEVKTILVAVDATDAVLDQAKEAGADMLLTHHPLIFKPVKSVTDRDFIGRRLLRLIQADCPYYAMHTNFDAAPGCMAALAGERLGLAHTCVLEEMGRTKEGVPYGIGLCGDFEQRICLSEAADRVKEAFGLSHVTVYGDDGGEKRIRRAAVCPGTGGGTLQEAIKSGADVYITGDIGHHEGIDAVAQGMSVIDAGHYGIEHIFVDFMADYLERRLRGQVRAVKEKTVFPCHVV